MASPVPAAEVRHSRRIGSPQQYWAAVTDDPASFRGSESPVKPGRGSTMVTQRQSPLPPEANAFQHEGVDPETLSRFIDLRRAACWLALGEKAGKAILFSRAYATAHARIRRGAHRRLSLMRAKASSDTPSFAMPMTLLVVLMKAGVLVAAMTAVVLLAVRSHEPAEPYEVEQLRYPASASTIVVDPPARQVRAGRTARTSAR